MRFGVLLLASGASAHTLFTTLFVNGKNQGDGTCVRMPRDPSTANSPVTPITGDVMACGRDGDKAVPFTCPVPYNATLTFEFRTHASELDENPIAPEHLGPCTVYLKKVDKMGSASAAGPGWFKIWEDGYNSTTGKWCVDKLIANKGLLSVELPTGLPAGYYLVRPEILALQNAVRGEPQFYLGCAQLYVQQGPEAPLKVPDDQSVSIPGYVTPDTPGLKYNLYEKPLKEFPIPGPKVFRPEGKASGSSSVDRMEGGVPSDCILKNANWCAKALPSYSTEEGCWASVKNCYDQGKVCYDTVPPSGSTNCQVWQGYCKKLEGGCKSGNPKGPEELQAKESKADAPRKMLPKPS